MGGVHRKEDLRQWGWWLRVNGQSLEDKEGRKWRSVREAFWVGRLGFPITHVSDEQQELLLRVLDAVDERWFGASENKHDLFAGDMMFWRFYMSWLSAIGMLDLGPDAGVLEAPLSDEGRAVLLMLRATRAEDWTAMPFSSVLAAVEESGRTPAEHQRETALRLFERQVEGLPFVFAREAIGRTSTVTLTGVGTGARMQTARVVWSQAFGDRIARDDFFAWIAERLDRWDDWGRMAYLRGPANLTQHLLQLLVVSKKTLAS